MLETSAGVLAAFPGVHYEPQLGRQVSAILSGSYVAWKLRRAGPLPVSGVYKSRLDLAVSVGSTRSGRSLRRVT